MKAKSKVERSPEKLEYLKEVIDYYREVRQSSWLSFYKEEEEDKLKEELYKDLELEGIDKSYVYEVKDMMKGKYDEEGRSQGGEFYTPKEWVEESYKYLDKENPNWREEYYIWDMAAGSGNLLRYSGVDPSRLFISTLEETDIEVLNQIEELKGATIFKSDFLKSYDQDRYTPEYLTSLPEKLQEIIKENKPLIFFMNPPYAVGHVARTEVSKRMKRTFPNNVGKASYDVFFQFCWKVQDMVRMYELSNSLVGVFGPTTFFLREKPLELLREYFRTFEYKTGMCIPAGEFSTLGQGIQWSIGFTLWKSKESYEGYSDPETKIYLDRKYTDMHGKIKTDGSLLHGQPRETLIEWSKSKLQEEEEQKYYPCMYTALQFAGKPLYEKSCDKKVKGTESMLGSLATGDVVAKASDTAYILSTPGYRGTVFIYEDNFWESIVSCAARLLYVPTWDIGKFKFTPPDTTVEGYKKWMYNALVFVLFNPTSRVATVGNMKWYGEEYRVKNKFYPISEEEVRNICKDELLLKDLEDHPLENEVILRKLEEAKPYLSETVLDYYEWCMEALRYSLNHRKDYSKNMEVVGISIEQMRKTELWEEILNREEKLKGREKRTVLNDPYLKRRRKVIEELRAGITDYGMIQVVD